MFPGGMSDSKMVAITWKVKEVLVQDLTKPMKMMKKCDIWCSHIDVYICSWLCN